MDGAESSGRTRFGAELRAQRGARKWTQVELGAKIGYSGSFVSDVERGDRGSSEDFAGRCDGVFALPGTFMRLWEDAQREAFPVWFAPIVPIEREAAKISGWEPNAVPGLLQTEGYARALIRARWPMNDEEEIASTLSARLKRQDILTRPKPPMCWWVISEGLLRQVVGGPEVMGDQIDRLIKSAAASGTVIQVLPFSAHDHAGTDGLFHLYERPGVPMVAYTECVGGCRLIQDHQEISDLDTMMGMLRAAALSREDSLALMRTIRRDLA